MFADYKQSANTPLADREREKKKEQSFIQGVRAGGVRECWKEFMIMSMKFEFTSDGGFQLNGEEQFLVSGEFQYFRVPMEDWRRRMLLLKEAGGNCLATYVPWLIHEPVEGTILFDDVSYRSLTSFLELAREMGLAVILRPGPYVCSELICGGYPLWLIENYPEVMAQDIQGNLQKGWYPLSYLHPVLLEKARVYYRAFAEVVRPFLNDPVVMFQLDNELKDTLDYHPVTMGIGTDQGRYPSFLKKKYETIGAVNAAYSLHVSDWSEIRPQLLYGQASPAARKMKADYCEFYREVQAEYFSVLTEWLYEDGLKLPVCHNSKNPQHNGIFTKAIKAVKAVPAPFLLGSDHYYMLTQKWAQNNPTPQYAVNMFCSMELLRNLGMPPTVFELPGGGFLDMPPILPEDLLACHMTNLAMGMKGMNFYIFTGGPNVPGTGGAGDAYDFHAFIRADGSINSTYENLKSFGKLLKDNAWIQHGRRRGSAVIGYEWALTEPEDLDGTAVVFSRKDCREFFWRGVVYIMMCSKFAPELVSLDHELDLFRPLIVPSPSVMSEKAQKKLIEYVERGGKLLLMGDLPETDEDFAPCTLLRDYLGVEKFGTPYKHNKVIRYEPVGNMHSWESIHVMDSVPEGAVVLCKEAATGKTVGFSKNYGSGQVIYLSFRGEMGKYDQAVFLEKILESLGAVPCVESSNRNIFTSLIEDKEGHQLLMAMNLYSSPQSTELTVYDRNGAAERHEQIDLSPMEVKTLEWATDRI